MTQEKKSVIISTLPSTCQKMIQKDQLIQNKSLLLSKTQLAAKMCQVLKINFQSYSRWIHYLIIQNQELYIQQKSKQEESTPVIIQIDSQHEKTLENKIIQKQSVVESNKRKNTIQKQKEIKTKNPARSSQKPPKKQLKHLQKIKFLKKQIKQNLVQKVSQTPIVKPSKSKLKQKQFLIDLVDWIYVKNDQIGQNQLAEKKESLLKRTVVDWNFIDKNRSERRELRMLKN